MVALVHDATMVIFYLGKEGEVLFQDFFDSDIIVLIC